MNGQTAQRCVATALLAFAFAAGCARESVSVEEERAALLSLHQASLDAHLASDIDAFLEPWAEEVLMVNRGVMDSSSKEAARLGFSNYLSLTTFEHYRDRKPPIVEVSQDGTLGWVAAEVEAKGVHRGEGGETPVEFVSAWVSLYKKIDGEWRLVGNASNFAE